ncbi:hypothetical protein NDU88_011021 [Pleurodeles waltl]|uniref:Uncharacterized protein n=1 Tax=Pleurodeles waltl TaxID=8319 RepID=A0AAV7S521_PLEWA|nr:hypothetical protein NDU88_011021 [Pleurodeles waltl]
MQRRSPTRGEALAALGPVAAEEGDSTIAQFLATTGKHACSSKEERSQPEGHADQGGGNPGRRTLNDASSRPPACWQGDGRLCDSLLLGGSVHFLARGPPKSQQGSVH